MNSTPKKPSPKSLIPDKLSNIEALRHICAVLRGPTGCPWDKEQTHQTLAPYAIEETFEMIEAIEKNDDTLLREELGDVLFQVVLHAQLASEQGRFSLDDIIEHISTKLVRRHPHVFADVKVQDSDEVRKNWEVIKQSEKGTRSQNSFDVPLGLPALQRAEKIGAKTAKTGFDWSEVQAVLAKVDEELSELKEAIQNHSCTPNPETAEHQKEELGDVLFSLAQLGRHLQIDSEGALRAANQKFEKRYFAMLARAKERGLEFTQLCPIEKEKLWREGR